MTERTRRTTSLRDRKQIEKCPICPRCWRANFHDADCDLRPSTTQTPTYIEGEPNGQPN